MLNVLEQQQVSSSSASFHILASLLKCALRMPVQSVLQDDKAAIYRVFTEGAIFCCYVDSSHFSDTDLLLISEQGFVSDMKKKIDRVRAAFVGVGLSLLALTLSLLAMQVKHADLVTLLRNILKGLLLHFSTLVSSL